MTEPKIGDEIYVPSALFVYRGSDDFAGGKAIIDKIDKSKTLPPDHFNYISVGIKERPGTMYNYKNLIKDQEKLKKEYGDRVAHPDPDNDPEFNCHPNADWKFIK